MQPVGMHVSRRKCSSSSRISSSNPFIRHRRMTQTSSRSPRWAVITRSWQQVFDQASGKPYYWNTATNEKAWELPPGTTAASSSSSSTIVANNPQQQQEQQQQEPQVEEAMSFDALYTLLQEAYTADGSFWEVARAHRRFGVFDPPFFEFLEVKQRQLAGVNDDEGREMAFKVMCRLSNPLLRQPAPFESL